MGKKDSWRHRIDLSDVHSGIDTLLAQERAVGGKVHERKDEQLFVVDKNGDAAVGKKMKTLRVDEVLRPSSAIPPLRRTCQRNGGGQSKNCKKALEKTKRLLAKKNCQAEQPPVSPTGVASSGMNLWNSPDSVDGIPVRSARKPAPSQIFAPNLVSTIDPVHPGSSYNPLPSLHQEAIMLAVDREFSRRSEDFFSEKASGEAVVNDHSLLIQKMTDDADEEESTVCVGAHSRKERPRITRVKRNARIRHKEQLEIANRRKRAKAALSQIDALSSISSQVRSTQEKAKQNALARTCRERMSLRKTKKLGKHAYEPPMFPVNLELSSSLRALPSDPSDALYYRFKKLQQKNLIEVRHVAKLKRKYSIKTYEKPSYKNFHKN